MFNDWFGIVDGTQSNLAVRRLMQKHESWAGFKWQVTVIPNNYSQLKYQQISRAQNARRSEQCTIDVTLFDELSNLRRDYDTLSIELKKPTHTDVARMYFSSETVNRTMTLKASVASRLSSSVLDCWVTLCMRITRNSTMDLALITESIVSLSI